MVVQGVYHRRVPTRATDDSYRCRAIYYRAIQSYETNTAFAKNLKGFGAKIYGQTFFDVHKAQNIQNRVTRTPETMRSVVAD
jgi:hypothetical protein